MSDPWAPSPKWEPYQRVPDERFAPVDTQAFDLSNFLRGEVQKIRGQSTREEAVQGSVMLPDGRPAQLTQTATGEWELMVHVKRDWFMVYKARTRDAVIRLAIGEGHVRDD
jgi:hypothetical protein